MDHVTWNKVKDLIADALERPPNEREAFLEARCPSPTLRAEIRALLDTNDEIPTDFLEEATHVDDLKVDELPLGSRVGPYLIVDSLGRGGMGQVFLGNDVRLHRKVALKSLLTSKGSSADERARVVREARAAAQVNHPNVATIHDIIEHEARTFIVMEYVPGETLAVVMRRERLPIDRVVAIGRQLAAALTAAHARGVIHRDLKPANIQLTVDGSVKVLDFGVAGATAAFTTVTTATAVDEARAGQPGTRGYMSPEQVLNRHVDERSDIFSVGIVLFEMATGERAYPNTETIDLIDAVLRPVRRADWVDRSVPRGLADLIARALEVDPGTRFQSAAALGSALEALHSRIDALDRPRVRLSTARVILRVAAAALCAFLLIMSLGFMINAVFNNTTGRTPPFNEEPLSKVMLLGFLSLDIPVLYMAAMLIVAWALRFVVRVLSLSKRIEGWFTAIRTRASPLASRLNLDEPAGFAQAVATLGIIALVAIVWQFSDLLLACMTMTISDASAERLLPLRYDLRFAPLLYRLALEALILGFIAALIRIKRLRVRQPAAQSGGRTPIVALLVLAVLMAVAPYRLLWNNYAERIKLGGDRCYVLGAHGDEMLVYCPDRNPPRNERINSNNPAIKRHDRPDESIFTPPDRPPDPLR